LQARQDGGRKVGVVIAYNVSGKRRAPQAHVPSLPFQGEAEHRRGEAPRSASAYVMLGAVGGLATSSLLGNFVQYLQVLIFVTSFRPFK